MRRPLLAALFVLAAAGAPLAGQQEESQQFVEDMVSDLTALGIVFRDAPADAEARFPAFLEMNFDVSSMSMSALPAAARVRLTRSGQARYLAAYRSYLASEFIETNKSGPVREARTIGTRDPGTGLIIVASEFSAPGVPRREVEWFVALTPRPRIVNAAVDGILITARQQRRFRTILVTGDIDDVIDDLQSGRDDN